MEAVLWRLLSLFPHPAFSDRYRLGNEVDVTAHVHVICGDLLSMIDCHLQAKRQMLNPDADDTRTSPLLLTTCFGVSSSLVRQPPTSSHPRSKTETRFLILSKDE